jgi:asparagine synthase (glutamine-hydrolysing)
MNGKIKEHIRNMLTLRYDPLEEPYIKTTGYKDWVPVVYETTAITLERKLIVALSKLENFNRIGIALSSGIDSVLLLRLLRHVFPNKEIIAFHYVGINDELEDVKQYADAYASQLITMSHPSVLDTLKWQTTITKEPMWDAFDYVLYQNASRMKCDVMVDGSGADELFGGYTFRYDNFNPTGTSTEAKFYAYMDVHQRDWVEDQAHLFGPEIPFEWNMIKENIIDNFGNPLDTICQIFMADYNGKLAHLFAKKQARFSNVYSIPIFSPYLDEYVAEYGMRLEPSLKIGKVGKLPLRQIAARYDISPTFQKLGFSHDTVKEWNDPEINAIAMDDITDPACQMYSQGLISWDWMQRHVHNDRDCQDVRYVNKFFQLLALEQWLRHRMHME